MGTLLGGDGRVFPTRFAFMACMQVVQSRYVLDGRLITRVCPPKHCERLFELTYALRPRTVHSREQVPRPRDRNRLGQGSAASPRLPQSNGLREACDRPGIYRTRQPEAEQIIRAGGSFPRLTAASTALLPCVRKASRVSSATTPFSSCPIAARDTSTLVQTSRCPSRDVDLTDQEAPMLVERWREPRRFSNPHLGSATSSR